MLLQRYHEEGLLHIDGHHPTRDQDREIVECYENDEDFVTIVNNFLCPTTNRLFNLLNEQQGRII